MLAATIVAYLLHLSDALDVASRPHEKRDIHEWNADRVFNRRRTDPETILPIRIALKENEHARMNAESWLLDVSHPHSEQFGRHWNQKDIVHAFQPTDESLEAVTRWLNDHDIFDFTHTDNRLWLAFDASAAEAERLLQTKFYDYEVRGRDGDALRIEVAAMQYYLPESVQAHVDFVTPGVQGRDITDRTERGRILVDRSRSETTLMKRREQRRNSQPPASKICRPLSSLSTLPRSDGSVSGVCQDCITPACVRALYGIPLANASRPVSPNNTMGFAEFMNDLYYQPDLDNFYQRYTDIPNGTNPIFRGIDDAKPPLTKSKGLEIVYSAESDTDLETALAIIYPQNATVFQVSQAAGRSNYFNRLLDALDGSECTPQQRTKAAGGGKPQCGIYKPPNIISMSWGDDENIFSELWQRRQCNEYLKLGLQRVSVFVSSGDYGVSIIPHTSRTKGQCPHGAKFGTGVFNPQFPASCPWVTTVGGTQLANNRSLNTREEAVNWYGFNSKTNHSYYSAGGGGGFSNRFNRPHYQQSAVQHFFDTANPRWNYYSNGQYKNSTGRYNRNGRGFPDMAASAKDMPVCFGNTSQCVGLGGTSYSAPLCGAIFTRIIEERIRIGKGPLGFLNPTLYQHPEVFTDILHGGNGVCSPGDGFECAEGWDPVTGLGTPKYPELLEMFLKLP